MALFGSSKKNPAELARNLLDATTVAEQHKPGDKKREKAVEDISKAVSGIKYLLDQGSQELEAQMAQEVYHGGLIQVTVKNLEILDFEARKNLCEILKVLLKRQIGARVPTVDYFVNKTEVLFVLLKGYENHKVALTSGQLLRECMRYEPLADKVLASPKFFDLFTYVTNSEHEVASDAFSTLQDLLTRHKSVVSKFLEQKNDQFLPRYEHLIASDNHPLKLKSLKLLCQLLLDRNNFVTMTKYINNVDNLQRVMNLLRDENDDVQFEAFHAFKIFVANPNKPQEILDVLVKNKDKLLEFLKQFHAHRTEDEQFNDEKSYIIEQIEGL